MDYGSKRITRGSFEYWTEFRRISESIVESSPLRSIKKNGKNAKPCSPV